MMYMAGGMGMMYLYKTYEKDINKFTKTVSKKIKDLKQFFWTIFFHISCAIIVIYKEELCQKDLKKMKIEKLILKK